MFGGGGAAADKNLEPLAQQLAPLARILARIGRLNPVDARAEF